MAKKNVGELIELAKAVTVQASATADMATTDPEMTDAIQSVALKIKRIAGADSDLTALV